ncbi:hypothetical protein NDN08_001105 [Rhodosorus marinus]|uniref:Uncharacterized protein n=1 Tax=Rhodosorus marinus TaxID=101924 RepID=A0AAV8UTY4_9RHOD|nr:hypothetical protein NDN08_001105 [Rhodosorus marinus]
MDHKVVPTGAFRTPGIAAKRAVGVKSMGVPVFPTEGLSAMKEHPTENGSRKLPVFMFVDSNDQLYGASFVSSYREQASCEWALHLAADDRAI